MGIMTKELANGEHVAEILDEVEGLIKLLEEPEPCLPRARKIGSEVVKQIRELRKMLDNKSLAIQFAKTYWIFWNDDSVSEGHGYSITDAMTTMSYGAGAVGAIDFYTKVPTNEEMAMRVPTMPDGIKNRRFVVDAYLKGILEFFVWAKDSIPEKDYVQLLEEFFDAYDDSMVMTCTYPEEKAEFMGLHQRLVGCLNPITRHGKMYYEKFFGTDPHTGAIHAKMEMYEDKAND